MLPSLTSGNIATESLHNDKVVRRIRERHHETMKEFRKAEFSKKLERVKDRRPKGY